MQPDSRHINQLLEAPGLIGQADIVDLQFWAIEYPQVPLFRMFLAKKAMQTGHESREQYRMEAAAMMTDRGKLYAYLEQNIDKVPVNDAVPNEVSRSNFTANPEPEVIQQQVREDVFPAAPIESLVNPVSPFSAEWPMETSIDADDKLEESGIIKNIEAIAESVAADSTIPAVQELEEVAAITREKVDIAVPPKISGELPPSLSNTEIIDETASDVPPPTIIPLVNDVSEKEITITVKSAAEEETFDLTGKVVKDKPAHTSVEPVVQDAGLHSFIEWLDLIDKKTGDGEPRIPVKEDWIEAPALDYFPKLEDDLPIDTTAASTPLPIEKFDKHDSVRAEQEVPERVEPIGEEDMLVVRQAQLSLEFSENLMTETLAKLYIKQGKKLKALKIYRALALHNPEKSSYFAALIQQLEES